MIPKEKAKELIKSYYYYVSGWTSTNRPDENPSAQYEGEKMKIGRAKQCALIAVEEVINALNYFGYANTMYDDFETGKIIFIDDKLPETYWNMVKHEIEKL